MRLMKHLSKELKEDFLSKFGVSLFEFLQSCWIKMGRQSLTKD